MVGAALGVVADVLITRCIRTVGVSIVHINSIPVERRV